MYNFDEETLREEFIDIVENKRVNPVYQGIFCLRSGEALGYEALSRGPKDSLFYSPEYLFKAAQELNMVWELDKLCRHVAIKEARGYLNKNNLFLNIDPNIINDPSFKKGFTRELLSSYEIETNQIVFEITEHTAINDFEKFNQILDNYRGQGYKIAIDDVGNGHSGLRVMTETRPSYIKLDMGLVRNIDKDIIKKELIKSFVKFAEITGLKLIAEGIETRDELKTLVLIGVHYGQGFLLQRPKAVITQLDNNVQRLIKYFNTLREKIFYRKENINIGDISRCDETLYDNCKCFDVNVLFERNKILQAIVVINKQKSVIGLIMRNKFYYNKAIAGNESQFLNMSVMEIVDRNPLIVERRRKLIDVCNMCVSRKEDRIYDCVVIIENGRFYGIVPVANLLNILVVLNNLESSKISHTG